MTKGIILAGGAGTRLHPVTISTIKQLLPVYDKPMIYYPLATLMIAGVREILVISTPEDLPRIEKLLGSGEQWGLRFEYAEQSAPRGIAEALVIGEKFIGDDPVWLILGDNIFFGHGLPELLQDTSRASDGATVFGYYVSDPQRYGVAEFDDKGRVISIEEKPAVPKSNYAVTGIYHYDKNAPRMARGLNPSKRGELEITALNNEYLRLGKLNVKLMGRGFAWLDTGTHDSLLDAADFVRIVENRQGLKIACVEEIAYRNGYISAARLEALARPLEKTGYGQYLLGILKEPAAKESGHAV
ncbi:MAG: glucose-1-phosphate thymidylyltransferase RfbA [Elusimicrobiaceae bacterium]|nr:glucose-1-phosphate thymidylyltransferase RfbA [Elusimicrobiaceae bacterium]